MSKILFCDRCGVQIAVDPGDKLPYNSGHCTRIYNKAGRLAHDGYDLCCKCDDELAEFLKKKEK